MTKRIQNAWDDFRRQRDELVRVCEPNERTVAELLQRRDVLYAKVAERAALIEQCMKALLAVQEINPPLPMSTIEDVDLAIAEHKKCGA